MVSAGGHLYKIAIEESWYGFLYDLLIEQIGPGWFDAEMAKPKGGGHILTRWYHDICRRERDKNGHFTRYDPANEIGTTLAFRSIAYDVFCMMQAINLSPKIMKRLRHPGQFEGARYELWVAATLARAGFSIEFADEDDRLSMHGEGIATHQETGKKYWFEAKRKHRPTFDYLQALVDNVVLKVALSIRWTEGRFTPLSPETRLTRSSDNAATERVGLIAASSGNPFQPDATKVTAQNLPSYMNRPEVPCERADL